MVVSPSDIDFFHLWPTDFLYKQLCIGPFYLFTFLMLMKREKGLETIVVLTLVCLIGFLKFDANWLIYTGLVLLTIGVISKIATIAIGKYWFLFSFYFGSVMNYVIMFFIFSFILIPLSFLQRLFGHNKILKKNTTESNFHIRNHPYTEKDIEKPWQESFSSPIKTLIRTRYRRFKFF